jgi:coenzyme PQQ precursor peptide PqqA
VAEGLRKMAAARPGRTGGQGQQPFARSIAMKWETPTAIDLRFGMEITMYIANR